MQKSITIFVWGTTMETDKTTWSDFINGKDTVEQILGSVKINKSRNEELRDSQAHIQVGKLAISVMQFDRDKLQLSSKDLSVPLE